MHPEPYTQDNSLDLPRTEPLTRSDTRELAERGRERLADVKARANTTMDQTTTSIGRRVESAGDSLESAARSAGGSFRRAGKYLQNADPATMGEDLVALMRKHPGATLCVGIGIGVMASRALRSR